MAFLDLIKAFGSVSRALLWLILRRLGAPVRFVARLQKLHERVIVHVSPDVQSRPATRQCTGTYLHSGALLERQKKELPRAPSAQTQKAHYLDVLAD